MSATTSRGDEQVLTFALGDQRYCVSIDRVAEIVDYDQQPTRLPESPPHVEGIIDLRGRTSTVVNPKQILDEDDETTDGRHIVVFDSGEEGAHPTGWIVDEVHQVIGFDADDVDSDVESDLSKGIIRSQDDDFLIWLDPDGFET